MTILCCLCAACQRIPTVGLLERDVKEPHITSHQLRVLVNEHVVFSSHRLELCADNIIARNPDNAVRKSALLLKINGIAACFQAASRHDPLAAYLDLWVLNRQMMHLFESPVGHELFGPLQAEATAECHALDERLQSISQMVGSDLRHGEEFVEKFACDFPLNGLHFDREPIASRYIEEVRTPSRELIQVVANLDGNIDDLRKLTILYAEHLPKQARWEAELFLIDSTQLSVVQRPLQDLTVAADAVSRIADTTQALPQIIEKEFRVLSALVTKECKETVREVEVMRNQTMIQLGVERSLILAAIRNEREASFASLSQERFAVTSDLKAEVSRVVDATDVITHKRTIELAQHIPKVIDHFFWRTWQFCSVLAIVAAILGWGLFHVRSQRSKSRIAAITRTRPEASNLAVVSASKQRNAA